MDEAAVDPASAYWKDIVAEVKAAGSGIRHAVLTNHAAAHLLMWAEKGRAAPKADIGIIEAMLAYPSVDEFVREKEREIECLHAMLRRVSRLNGFRELNDILPEVRMLLPEDGVKPTLHP